MTEIFVPPIAQHMADDLLRDTEVAATVRKYVSGYLLEHENEHVRLTIRYKQRGGKWSWAGSTLTIDGERQKLLAHGYDDYVKIFKQGHRDNPITDGAPVIEMPDYPAADETEAPAVVREALIANRKEGRKHGIPDASSLVTLHRYQDIYIVSCSGPFLTVNITFTRQPDGEWSFGWCDDIVLAIAREEDGTYRDVTKTFVDLGFDVNRLLAAMGRELPSTDIPRQIHHTAEPKRLNSVEVRRTTVIRV